mgnify:CR=1 FL=1
MHLLPAVRGGLSGRRILLTQNFEFVADTKDDFVYNKEQLKNVPWYKDIDPLNSREPDRDAWIGEGTGEVDYQ